MNIVISPSSDDPIYQQLADQLQMQIIRGEIVPDEPLPPIRTIAKELRISIITVKKAWELLERDGYIYTVVGRGSFAASLSCGDIAEKREMLVQKKLSEAVVYCKSMGLELNEICRVVKDLYE